VKKTATKGSRGGNGGYGEGNYKAAREFDASLQLTDGYGGQVNLVRLQVGDPGEHGPMGFGFTQFRDHIGVEQEAVQLKSTGGRRRIL